MKYFLTFFLVSVCYLCIGQQTIFTTQNLPTAILTDGQPIELGLKFKADVPGQILGVRYYRVSSAFSGTKTGELYSSTGTRLAQKVLTSETASGWQNIIFSSPVPVTAGSTYVAAFHSTSGQYAVTNGSFAADLVNGNVRAIAAGGSGNNGVYAYTSTPTFPNSFCLGCSPAGQGSNYWVDILFQADAKTLTLMTTCKDSVTLPTDSISLIAIPSTNDSVTLHTWKQLGGPSSYNIPGNVDRFLLTGLKQGIYTFQYDIKTASGLSCTSKDTITVLAQTVVPKKVVTSVYDQNGNLIQSSTIQL